MGNNLQIRCQSPPKRFIIEQYDGISWAVIDTAHDGEAQKTLDWWLKHHPKISTRITRRKYTYNYA